MGTDGSSLDVMNLVLTDPKMQFLLIIGAYRDIFSTKTTPVNAAKSLEPAVIDTGGHPPIKQPGYRMPLTKRQKVEECVQEMLQDKIIQPSSQTDPPVCPVASTVPLAH